MIFLLEIISDVNCRYSVFTLQSNSSETYACQMKPCCVKQIMVKFFDWAKVVPIPTLRVFNFPIQIAFLQLKSVWTWPDIVNQKNFSQNFFCISKKFDYNIKRWNYPSLNVIKWAFIWCKGSHTPFEPT